MDRGLGCRVKNLAATEVVPMAATHVLQGYRTDAKDFRGWIRSRGLGLRAWDRPSP